MNVRDELKAESSGSHDRTCKRGGMMRVLNHAGWMSRVLVLLVMLASPGWGATELRPRLIVLTDFFKDPDDKQSMIRLLAYANEFEIEGLIATSLAFGDGSVRPELLHEIIEDYARVYPTLRQHDRPGHAFPEPETLHARVKAGAPVVRTFAGRGKGFPVPYPAGAKDSRRCDPAEKWIGAGRDTAASEHIIHVVDQPDERPVWVAVWGGAMDLAQALWKVRHERSADEAARFVRKLRVHQISWQDTGAVWIWENVPDLFLIQNSRALSGMYAEGPTEVRDAGWLRRHVLVDHGPLGAGYPGAHANGRNTLQVKEGDSPSFLHLLARGLSDPEQPEWGGWGGRFVRLHPDRQFFVDARDRHPESTDPAREMQWTVGRWHDARSRAFAARMDRCVAGPKAVNHAPVVHVGGDSSTRVVHRAVTAGETVRLDAAGTHDPDGHRLTYRWWQYAEAGTYAGHVALGAPEARATTLTAPAVARSATVHVVLEVTDDGEPALTSYRRVVLTVEPAR